MLRGRTRIPWWVLVCWLALAPAMAWAQSVGSPVVRVGVYDNPPKIFMGSDQQPTGIFGDLLREVARQEGWTLQAVRCEWQDCLDQLQAGRIDLMPDVARTPERETLFRFLPTPALHGWSQVYRHPSQQVASILDLQGKRVAYLQGSVQQAFFANLLENFNIQAAWVAADSLDQAFALVEHQQADVALANVHYGDWKATSHSLLGTPIMFQPVALHVVSGLQSNPAWLQAVDRRLAQWKADPTSPHHGTLRRWGSPETPPRIPAHMVWVMLAGVGVLALLALTVAWLRREVARKTRDIRASEARLNTILDSVDAAIYIKGTDFRYRYVNRKVAQIFGTPADQVVGKRDEDFFDRRTADHIHQNDSRVLNEKIRLTAEEVNRNLGSDTEQVYLSVKLPLLDASGQVYALCGISTDVTEQRQATEEIHRLAYFDPLTQLPNRRALLDRMAREMALAQRTGRNGALVFIDLDHFKEVNDLLGHAAGDELLRSIAIRLSSSLRNTDTLARIGGDEFVLLLADLDSDRDLAADQALSTARKLKVCFGQPVPLAERPYTVTASMGIAMFTDAAETPENLLRWADMAMYAAKDGGRNEIRFFNAEMQTRAEAHADLLQDVRRAIQHHEFILHYQPQLDTDGRLCGIEALVRWQHPDKGLVQPGTFIPVIENTDLMVPLGQDILRLACAQLAQWQHLPMPQTLQPPSHWRLAINISAKQFHHVHFVEHVKHVIDQTRADPHRIELELTESLLLNNVDHVIEKMGQLQALGIAFSLDDFGTGYSSLSYLKRLPLYKIKIDQSFVRDLDSNTNSQAIVRTIVALSDSLELKVIAEGVENSAQKAQLLQLGCHQYQGYLFSRPVAAAELQAGWLV
ncbi:MAG: EAL domain-containing protein [Hydrogenophaga sp.]|nr:EAL domain-containing protein [Hydrogenophaga sp.]